MPLLKVSFWLCGSSVAASPCEDQRKSSWLWTRWRPAQSSSRQAVFGTPSLPPRLNEQRSIYPECQLCNRLTIFTQATSTQLSARCVTLTLRFRHPRADLHMQRKVQNLVMVAFHRRDNRLANVWRHRSHLRRGRLIAVQRRIAVVAPVVFAGTAVVGDCETLA